MRPQACNMLTKHSRLCPCIEYDFGLKRHPTVEHLCVGYSGAPAVLIASGNWVCLFITNRVWQALGSLDISQYVVCVVSEVSIYSLSAM